jgi:hypothetical protein
MEFSRLVEATVEDRELRQAIDQLMARKQAGDELDRRPRIPSISEFIERELDRLERATGDLPKAQLDIERLNSLFRTVLERVWA